MSVMNKVRNTFACMHLNINHAPWKYSKHRCPLDLILEERISVTNESNSEASILEPNLGQNKELYLVPGGLEVRL